MTKKLYVGNLSYNTTEAQVRALFAQVGEVESVSLITDRETGRAKGFGFVEMSTDEASQEAIKRFNGYTLDERVLTVNEARPREERPRGGGFGGDSRGGGYGGGFGGGNRREGRSGGGRDSRRSEGGYGGNRKRF
jgi:RNA recognition motif-containing protein